MINETAKTCPLCGSDNRCEISEVLKGGSCWCMANPERFPRELLQLVPPKQRGQSCICQSCLRKFKLEQEEDRKVR